MCAHPSQIFWQDVDVRHELLPFPECCGPRHSQAISAHPARRPMIGVAEREGGVDRADGVICSAL